MILSGNINKSNHFKEPTINSFINEFKNQITYLLNKTIDKKEISDSFLHDCNKVVELTEKLEKKATDYEFILNATAEHSTNLENELSYENEHISSMAQRYEFIVNTSQEFLLFVDKNYCYRAVNDIYCQALQKSREKILDQELYHHWGSEIFNTILKPKLNQCFNGKVVSYQFWYDFPNLKHRYLDVVNYPYTDQNGVITHSVMVCRDITTKKQNEDALALAHQKITSFITEILELTPSLILVFDQQGIIKDNNSKIAYELFGHDIQGKNFLDLLLKGEEELKESKHYFDRIVKMSNNADTFTDFMSLLCKQIKLDDKIFKLSFFPKLENDKIVSIFMLGINITQEAQAKEKTQKALMFIEMLKEPETFSIFKAQCEQNFEETLNQIRKGRINFTRQIGEDIYRNLHTIKGSVSSFKMFREEEMTHQLENDLEKIIQEQQYHKLVELEEGAEKLYSRYLVTIAEFENLTDKDSDKTYTISTQEFLHLQELLTNNNSTSALKMVEKFKFTPLRKFLNSKCKKLVQNICDKLDKQVDLIVNLVEERRFDEDTLNILGIVLTHLLRNAIDHGIESEEERLELKKTAKGKITIIDQSTDSELCIKIGDDGRGINPEAIKEKLIVHGLADEKKLATMKNDEIYQYIFTAGLSTRDEASEVSGRGVGMDAVQAILSQHEGRIEVKSEPGLYTEFIIHIPLKIK